jgi:hypothetical protein
MERERDRKSKKNCIPLEDYITKKYKWMNKIIQVYPGTVIIQIEF